MHHRLFKLEPTYSGVLVDRVGRFIVRVRVGGEIVLAHNTNTGRLLDVLSPGRGVLLVSTGSRLKYRLVGVEDVVPGCFSIVDVLTQARAFERSLELGLLPYFRGCRIERRNPPIDRSRLDYLLKCGQREVLVETKSAVMRGPGGEAMYPDCETPRGRRHLRIITELATAGLSVGIVFVSAMCSVRCFKPNEDGDREVAALLREALKRGIAVKSVSVYMSNGGDVYLSNPDIPLCMDD